MVLPPICEYNQHSAGNLVNIIYRNHFLLPICWYPAGLSLGWALSSLFRSMFQKMWMQTESTTLTFNGQTGKRAECYSLCKPQALQLWRRNHPARKERQYRPIYTLFNIRNGKFNFFVAWPVGRSQPQFNIHNISSNNRLWIMQIRLEFVTTRVLGVTSLSFSMEKFSQRVKTRKSLSN